MGVMANRKQSNRAYCYMMAEMACESLLKNDKQRAILFAKNRDDGYFDDHIVTYKMSTKGCDAMHNDNFRREVIDHARDYMRVLIHNCRENL